MFSISNSVVTRLRLLSRPFARSSVSNVLVSRVLARHLGIGDEITFPISPGDKTGVEIYIPKSSVSSGLNRCLYQAPIGYVTQPKLDKCNQHFVSAEVQQKALGIFGDYPSEPNENPVQPRAHAIPLVDETRRGGFRNLVWLLDPDRQAGGRTDNEVSAQISK